MMMMMIDDNDGIDRVLVREESSNAFPCPPLLPATAITVALTTNTNNIDNAGAGTSSTNNNARMLLSILYYMFLLLMMWWKY